jgi:hypothetical protein
VLVGRNEHGTGEPSEPTTLEIDFTSTLDHQDGRRVWGTISSPQDAEPWLGVIGLDGTTVLGADTDGHIVGTLQDPDTLELCYIQAQRAIVAGCGVLSRQ